MQNKISYAKPVVLASSKNGGHFLWCNSKNGTMPIICRCDGK